MYISCMQVENPVARTTREGLCSHFLSRQKPGELIRVAVRPSEFRSPADLSNCPVIMVRRRTKDLFVRWKINSEAYVRYPLGTMARVVSVGSQGATYVCVSTMSSIPQLTDS